MFLNKADLKKFDEDGYLFFPEMFNSDEASLFMISMSKPAPSELLKGCTM